MSRTRKTALAGILSALAVVCMMMGGLIPLATFCCPALAGILLIPIFVECGESTAWGAWFVTAVLSLMLSTDKESALLFLFIGYYPVLRWRLEQIRSSVLRLVSKLGVFNIAVITMYALCIFILKMDAIVTEYREAGLILTGVTLLLGNFVLFVYDILIGRFTFLYVNRLRDKLIR